MSTLELKSYAKINLSLDILGIRPDGYHDVVTVMQKTSLYDEISIMWEDGTEFVIEVTTNKPYLPTDERNLAYKAASLMQKKSGRCGTLKIDLIKHVPVSAGLAGGSGNAAAVLIGLNRIWKLKYDTKTLCEFAKELGSDVPFLVLVQNSRFCIAAGRGTGDELEPINRSFYKDMVIAKPNFGISTREVYQGIDGVEIPLHPDTDALIKGIRKRDFDRIYGNMVNVLENYTLKMHPEVKRLKDIMEVTEKPEKVMMSGSGPSIMGFYGSKEEARKACMKLREAGYEAYWLHTAN